jgi:ParB/RepB/Spo0J family partition protein
MGEQLKATEVDPHTLIIPEERIWSEFTEEELSLFKTSIQNKGIELPIKAIKVNGELVVVDGANRIKAAIEYGIQKVPVVWRTGTLEEVEEENLFLNYTRGRSDPVHMIAVVGRLYEKLEGDFQELITRTGFSKGYLSKLLKIATAHRSIFEALSRHEITIESAYQLSRLKTPEHQEQCCAVACKYRMTAKMLQRTVPLWIEDSEKPPPERKPLEEVIITTHQCRFCGQEWEREDMVNVTMCVVCYGQLLKAAKERALQQVSSKKNGSQEGGV